MFMKGGHDLRVVGQTLHHYMVRAFDVRPKFSLKLFVLPIPDKDGVNCCHDDVFTVRVNLQWRSQVFCDGDLADDGFPIQPIMGQLWGNRMLVYCQQHTHWWTGVQYLRSSRN